MRETRLSSFKNRTEQNSDSQTAAENHQETTANVKLRTVVPARRTRGCRRLAATTAAVVRTVLGRRGDRVSGSALGVAWPPRPHGKMRLAVSLSCGVATAVLSRSPRASSLLSRGDPSMQRAESHAHRAPTVADRAPPATSRRHDSHPAPFSDVQGPPRPCWYIELPARAGHTVHLRAAAAGGPNPAVDMRKVYAVPRRTAGHRAHLAHAARRLGAPGSLR